MEIVKKNLISIICGAIALLAVVANFYPLSGRFDEMNKQLADRKKVNDSINSLLRQQRKAPNVNPDRAEVEVLKAFPTGPLIVWGVAQTQRVKVQAQQMMDIAVGISRGRKTLLSPDSLPEPRSGYAVPANIFVTLYGAKFSPFSMSGASPGAPPTLIQVLNATVPPTAKEITDAQAELAAKYDSEAQKNPAPEIEEKKRRDVLLKPNEMRAKRAELYSMYVGDQNTLGLHYHANIAAAKAAGQPPAPLWIWWAQQGLWIQEDVIEAIVQTNKGSKKVADSVVKRLIQINIPDAYMTDQGPLQIPGTARSAGAGNRFAHSPTGRVSNSMYDVVHFDLIVDVDANRFPEFLSELNRNRFINVLTMDLAGVDRNVMRNAGYVYGNNPVATLTMRCEAILMRQWTKQWMPREVREALGIQDQNPGGR